MQLAPNATVTDADLRRGQHALVRDAAWASLTGALYGGVILVGFALALGAGPFVIGLLSAIPFIAQAVQLPAIVLIERIRQRRKIAVVSVSVARALILVLALVPFVAPNGAGLVVVAVAQLVIAMLGSITGCAVNSWLHQLLPRAGLGAFFSRRLFWATTSACLGTLAAGYLVDHWPFGVKLHAYSVAFAGAAVAGFVSVGYLSTVPEPRMTDGGPAVSIVEKILAPFRDPAFRRVLVYLASWNAASNLASPFVAVFLINQLGFSLGTVTVLWVASQLANALTLYLWGRLSDRLTNKAILAVALPAWFASVFALVFVAAAAEHHRTFPALLVIHVVMGAASGGIGLAAGNMSLKLAPAGQGTAYLGATSLVGSITGTIAPIVGGALAQWFKSLHLSLVVQWGDTTRSGEVALIQFAHWGFLFAISALLGLYVLHALSRIHEGARISERVVIQEFALEALRTFNQFSSIAGLLGNLFLFGRPRERRLFARSAERRAPQPDRADAVDERAAAASS